MNRVDQTVFCSQKGNCFSACVASILEISILEVPFFMVPEGWYEYFSEWLGMRNLYPLNFAFSEWPAIQGAEFRRSIGMHPSRLGIETELDIIIIAHGVKDEI